MMERNVLVGKEMLGDIYTVSAQILIGGFPAKFLEQMNKIVFGKMAYPCQFVYSNQFGIMFADMCESRRKRILFS